MADEDLFNLDDFQEPEVSDNSINISSSKQEPEPENKIQEQNEIKEEPKDISTKANSDKQEIIKVEQPNQTIKISKYQNLPKNPKKTK